MSNNTVDFELLFGDESSRSSTPNDRPSSQSNKLPRIPPKPDNLLMSNKFTVTFQPEYENVWSLDGLGNYVKDIDFKEGEILFSFYNTKSFQFYRAANKLGCTGMMLVDITTYDGLVPVDTTRYRVRVDAWPWRSTLSVDDESFSLTYIRGIINASGEVSDIEMHDKRDLAFSASPW